jgi:hypothetical protein
VGSQEYHILITGIGKEITTLMIIGVPTSTWVKGVEYQHLINRRGITMIRVVSLTKHRVLTKGKTEGNQ